jgi:long-chain acyl-CoA synthetase
MKEVTEKMNSEIDLINKKLAPHEQIRRVKLVNDEWTPLNDLLSQTLKLKRHNLKEKYNDLITDIYKNGQ